MWVQRVLVVDVERGILPGLGEQPLLERQAFRSSPGIRQVGELLLDQCRHDLPHGPVAAGRQQAQLSMGVRRDVDHLGSGRHTANTVSHVNTADTSRVALKGTDSTRSGPSWRVRGSGIRAAEYFKQALRHRPLIANIESLEDCLANAYLDLGRLDEANAEYQRVLRTNPDHALSPYRLALDRRGQRADSRAELERFVQIWKEADPEIPELVDARARLAVR